MPNVAIQLAIASGLALSLSVGNSALIDRGGGLIYDDVNNVTWLQDANSPKTFGFANTIDGRLNWYEAVRFADQFAYHDSVRNRVIDGWRLPVVSPISNSEWGYCGKDIGYNVDPSRSELASLYYVGLGNLGYYDCLGFGPQPGWNPSPKPGPFIGLQADTYWYGTEQETYRLGAWDFGFEFGQQSSGSSKQVRQFVILLHDGDIAVIPEPSTMLMIVTGFAGLWVASYRRCRRSLRQ